MCSCSSKPPSAGLRMSLVLAIALCIGGCGKSAPDRPASAKRPNVVLVCMDTVRADRLGCYGYSRNPTTPHLDKLASQSVVFADASATEGWTQPSVASYMTGTYPAQPGVYTRSARGVARKTTHTLPDARLTLAEVLADR
ncbi:MAG: sulfatase-like hydrolase/transferase, partial [bacterium]|nr:sulfatase-like hydrolase/transferase [bacterium]